MNIVNFLKDRLEKIEKQAIKFELELQRKGLLKKDNKGNKNDKK